MTNNFLSKKIKFEWDSRPVFLYRLKEEMSSQYTAESSVSNWVRAMIIESFEGALDEEQKKDIINYFRWNNCQDWVPMHRWASLSWDLIAVPFGIEDTINNQSLLLAVKNTFLNDSSMIWREELQAVFQEWLDDNDSLPGCEQPYPEVKESNTA